MPTTAQVNPEQYRALFEPILAEGKDVLHLALSSGISGSVGSARIAAQTLSEKYPDRRIEVIDSLCASWATAFWWTRPSNGRQQGKTFPLCPPGLRKTAPGSTTGSPHRT